MKKVILFPVFFLLLVAALVSSLYFYRQYRSVKQKLDNPEAAIESDTQKLLRAVAKLMVLPTGEDPTVYVISDISKLAGQKIFANAQNGDQVLVYGIAQKLIIYRPSINKIIDVGSVAVTPTPSPTGVVIPTAAPTAVPTSLPTRTPVTPTAPADAESQPSPRNSP